MLALITMTVAVLATISSAGVFDTVKWCALPCSDGSTYVMCLDTYGSASQGECYLAPGLQCPNGLTPVGYGYDFGETGNVKFSDMGVCQQFLNRLKTTPNAPVVVSEEYKPSARSMPLTENQQRIKEALQWHSDYSLYSEEEKMLLGERILAGRRNGRDVKFSKDEVRDIGRQMFGFVANVLRSVNKSGVYTNSNCAGCSLIVQSILERVEEKSCGAISDTIISTICSASAVFEPFCSSIMQLSGFENFLSSMCSVGFNSFLQATNLRERANYVCSSLTCTSPQNPNQVTSSSQITGNCDLVQYGNQEWSLNARCDEMIKACDLIEKGLCVTDCIKELKEEGSGSFVVATAKSLAKLANGELPPAVESVQKLATECMGARCGGVDPDTETSVLAATPLLGLLLLAFAVMIF